MYSDIVTKFKFRLALLYLTPVELLLGRFPTVYLLQKYQLPQFIDFMSSVKHGTIPDVIKLMGFYYFTAFIFVAL